jgi:hypothetical protein
VLGRAEYLYILTKSSPKDIELIVYLEFMRTGLRQVSKSCCWQDAHQGSILEIISDHVSPWLIPKYQHSQSKIKSVGYIFTVTVLDSNVGFYLN